MCNSCSKLDELIARLKSLEKRTDDLHLEALLRLTIGEVEQQKKQLVCESEAHGASEGMGLTGNG
jgi:hypothetical protein